MYEKILVPLDGSELAECVLPHVESIAGGCGVVSVVLMRAYETYVPSANYAYINESLSKEIEEGYEIVAEKASIGDLSTLEDETAIDEVIRSYQESEQVEAG